MQMLLMICLLLIALPATAVAQRSSKQDASARGGVTAYVKAGETPAVPVNEVSTQVVSERKAGRNDLTRVKVREVERRLSEMGYWTGAVDGRFDPASRSALIAFQKWEGRPVTGKLSLDELEAIRMSAASETKEENIPTPATSSVEKEAWPKPREPGYAHVEVDLDRQVLLIINDEDAVRVLPVSTGSGKAFFDEGQKSVAYTPRGRFVVYDKTIGWEKGEFSAMYYSNYISGGVAIHGSHSVPTQPESHGCIRIPLFAAREVSRLMPLGTIVLVYDKVSFVSGRPWAENPKLRQAAVLNSASRDYAYQRSGTTTSQRQETKAKPKSLVTKKARAKSFRAGS